MGDREILETYSSSASKNTSETVIFHHGPKSLLTSFITGIIVHFRFHIRSISYLLHYIVCVFITITSEFIINIII